MHKKSSELSWGRSPSSFRTIIYTRTRTHTHTLAYRDLLGGNKKRFCLATDTIKSSFPLAGRLLALLGFNKTLHTPSWSCTGDGWTGMCAREWVTVVLWDRREGACWEIGGLLYCLTRGRAEAPRQQQLPPFWLHRTKRAPSVPLASRPPSLLRVRVHQSPPYKRSPQSSPALASSPSPVLFVQPGRKTLRRGRTRGPNHPGVTAFTCGPHSSKTLCRTGWG